MSEREWREWREAAVRAARAGVDYKNACDEYPIRSTSGQLDGKLEALWSALAAFARLDRGQRAREATERKVDGGG